MTETSFLIGLVVVWIGLRMVFTYRPLLKTAPRRILACVLALTAWILVFFLALAYGWTAWFSTWWFWVLLFVGVVFAVLYLLRPRFGGLLGWVDLIGFLLLLAAIVLTVASISTPETTKSCPDYKADYEVNLKQLDVARTQQLAAPKSADAENNYYVVWHKAEADRTVLMSSCGLSLPPLP